MQREVLLAVDNRKACLAEERIRLIWIRRQRSLSAKGEYTMPMIWLNRLIVQSGVTWGVTGFPLMVTRAC